MAGHTQGPPRSVSAGRVESCLMTLWILAGIGSLLYHSILYVFSFCFCFVFVFLAFLFFIAKLLVLLSPRENVCMSRAHAVRATFFLSPWRVIYSLSGHSLLVQVAVSLSPSLLYPSRVKCPHSGYPLLHKNSPHTNLVT